MIAYVQLVALPEASANFLIVAYVVLSVVIYTRFVWKEPHEETRHFFEHYVQHVFLCLLYLALGIYL